MPSDSTQGSRFANLRAAKTEEVEKRLAQLEARLQGIKADKKPLIFLGLCLSESNAGQILDAEFRPPIRRGDLSAAIDEGYRWIGIIDGVFHHQYTVSLVEIQNAIRLGARLYGSSSMGALRAAEAYPLGMIGVGTIYKWYRKEFIDSDDEVAIAFDEKQNRALSEPLVNIRATLDAAEHNGLLDVSGKQTVLEVAEAMHYPQRTYAGILAALTGCFPAERCAALARFFKEQAVDLKALDAVELLRRIKNDYEQRREPRALHD